MSLVFQNIDPPPPLRPASVYPPPLLGVGGGGHTRQAERGVGGQHFGRRETQDFMTLDRCISLHDLKSKITTIGGFCWGRGGGGSLVIQNESSMKTLSAILPFFQNTCVCGNLNIKKMFFYPLFREARAREGKLTGCYIAYVLGW